LQRGEREAARKLLQLRIFTRAEGGEAHCQVNNLPLPNGVMLDWLDNWLK
jgi:hypothetical protein